MTNCPEAKVGESYLGRRKQTFHIKDIDWGTSVKEVLDAAVKALGCRGCDVRVLSMVDAFGRTKRAKIRVMTTGAADKLMGMPRVRIGLVSCRVISAEKDGRCFRCGTYGHWYKQCDKEDKAGLCFRCGEREHMLRQCAAIVDGYGMDSGGQLADTE